MAQMLDKSTTGSSGFDAVLHGGYPTGRTTLLHGATGTGKTTIGMQSLLAGATRDEPGLFVSFEERAAGIRKNSLSLGWDLQKLEDDKKIIIMDVRPDPKAILAGEFDFSGLLALIDGACRTITARRVVIDALDILLQMLEDPLKERNKVYELHNWLLDKNLTALMTSKLYGNDAAYPFLEFMTDCVVHLQPLNQDRQRLLRVVKYRGSNFSSESIPYTIGEQGILMFPFLETDLEHRTFHDHVSTGLIDLDEMLSGGYLDGSCITIAGATGTGKTTFASSFALAACRRGERIVYLNFEESAGNLIAMMQSAGVDLNAIIENRLLVVSSRLAESSGPIEHLHQDIALIEELRPRHVILDAASSCGRMGSETAAYSYLLRLISHCRHNGITLLLTVQTTGFQQKHEIYGVAYSSLIDAIIFLDYIQVGGEVNRTLLVLKARGSKHSNQYREFIITGEGVKFMQIYKGKGGMLTGVARLEQELEDQYAEQRREQAIEAKKRELERLRAQLKSKTDVSQSEIEKAKIELSILESEREIMHDSQNRRQSMRIVSGKEDNPDKPLSTNDPLDREVD
ncbi:MAG: circadian clock protein KaiC [Chitinivibrionales bacterium]|nr:circadian clock protein KaiC [Chitinivibrionales bacterium]